MDKVEKLKALRDACALQQAKWTGGLIECGEFTYGIPTIHQWDDKTRLKVGKFCSIGGGVNILLGGEHHHEWLTTYPFDVLLEGGVAKSKGDVIIGNDVWIGDFVTILSGVTIGNGAVIGAGSVVARNVHSYDIVIGVPAKLLKHRNKDYSITNVLQGLKWWDWPLEKIADALPILQNEDVDALVEFTRRWKSD